MNQAKTQVNIGSHLELLVDDWLIDTQNNVSLELQQPRPEEVVWRMDKPWESETSCYFNVFSDGDLIRLYYRGHVASGEQVACYAESKDGIHFEKPALNLYEFDGCPDNNITFYGCMGRSENTRAVGGHNFTPFLDRNPQVPAEERYKAIGYGPDRHAPDERSRPFHTLGAVTSPDGIHWKILQDDPIITEGKFDSQNVAFWDEAAKIYRSYSRYVEPVAGNPNQTVRRAIQSCTSPDFRNWSPMQPNVYEEEPPEFYTNATLPAPNAPHILLSFPMRYIALRKKIAEHPVDSVSDAMFMSSRDGVHWDRAFKEAWISPCRDQRNWTDRCNMPARGIVQTADDEFSMYITEHYRSPDVQLRRFSIRRDGFASMHAGASKGEWMTRPLLFTGTQLVLNYRTSAAGSIRVEVQDETGQPLPRFGLDEFEELYGDELDAVAQWKNQPDLSALQNRPVRLRFVMQEADLFALRFRDATQRD